MKLKQCNNILQITNKYLFFAQMYLNINVQYYLQRIVIVEE